MFDSCSGYYIAQHSHGTYEDRGYDLCSSSNLKKPWVFRVNKPRFKLKGVGLKGGRIKEKTWVPHPGHAFVFVNTFSCRFQCLPPQAIHQTPPTTFFTRSKDNILHWIEGHPSLDRKPSFIWIERLFFLYFYFVSHYF